MSSGDGVGVVQALWRFPVKSMLGEQLDSVELTPGGIVGDRSHAIRDKDTGKIASAKHPKRWPDLLQCRAVFTSSPRAGEELPQIRMDLADGTTVMCDDPDVDEVLSRFFGREVELAESAENGYTIDELQPDESHYDPDGPGELVEQALGAAFFNERGLPSVVPESSFFDLFPLRVLTTSTLAELASLEPDSEFDARRFRMNVIVETPGRGFLENDWLGKALAIGGEAQIAVAIPDPRCVMPNLSHEELPRDPKVLKTLAKHNKLDIGGKDYPCAGVYAVAQTPGTLRQGDAVSLL